ncbi:MAG: Na/Pi symporter [Candidatus Aminicenantes bacterium]|nr:Na/Pi symporter [Candidatus Aminicenantes bacterium]MDH5714239.1 Na/Pi symporter [Candidatus Aminicenantes bacterium]
MPPNKTPLALSIAELLGVLYCFFVSIELMGVSLQLFGSGFAEQLIRTTANPLMGLFIGLLTTSIIQSSSVTTSMVVALVAGGMVPIANAIPIVLGANIGTTVTNTLVSLAFITRKEEFRRAFSCSIVDDFFNLLAVIIFLPLELTTGYLQWISSLMCRLFSGVGLIKIASPLKLITQPAVDLLLGATRQNGILSLIVALVILFLSLKLLVSLLKKLVVRRAERFIHEYLFKNILRAMLLGFVLTAVVQSSSVTLSLIVPLAGAGILTIEQMFPYALGANIGTPVTAIMASLVTGSPAAITIAFVHLNFNISGALLFLPFKPLRRVPIYCSNWIADVASNARKYAIIYLFVIFYVIPGFIVLLWRWLIV